MCVCVCVCVCVTVHLCANFSHTWRVSMVVSYLIYSMCVYVRVCGVCMPACVHVCVCDSPSMRQHQLQLGSICMCTTCYLLHHSASAHYQSIPHTELCPREPPGHIAEPCSF